MALKGIITVSSNKFFFIKKPFNLNFLQKFNPFDDQEIHQLQKRPYSNH